MVNFAHAEHSGDIGGEEGQGKVATALKQGGGGGRKAAHTVEEGSEVCVASPSGVTACELQGLLVRWRDELDMLVPEASSSELRSKL